MARTLLSVGGGLLGSAIPGIGTSVGFALGSAVGGIVGALLFPPKPTYGPRPSDTRAAPGTYGSPIAIVQGLSDVACDLVWVKGNKTDVRENKQSAGGKGLGGPTHITFDQFATFALLICDGPITGLRQLYFGKDLVYDGTAEALTAAIGAGDPVPLTGSAEGVSFRLYTGTADQDPDPAIQAEDPFAPAWRGMSYIVVEDLPLEKWGNQIPGDGVPVIAHVTTTPATKIDVGLPAYTVDPGVNTRNESSTYDAARGRFTVADTPGPSIEVYDILRGERTRLDDLTGVPHPWRDSTFGDVNDMPLYIGDLTAGITTYNAVAPVFAPDGSFYMMAETWNGGVKFGSAISVDAETGQFLAVLSTGINSVFDAAFGFAHGPTDTINPTPVDHRIRDVDWLSPDPLTGIPQYLYLRVVKNNSIYFGAISYADRGRVEGQGHALISGWTPATGTARIDINPAGDRIFAAYFNGSTFTLARIPIEGIRVFSTDFDGDAYLPDTSVTISSFTNLQDLVYDRDAGTIAVVGSEVVIFDEDLTEINRTSGLGLRNISGQTGRGQLVDSILWFSAQEGSSAPVKDTIVGVSTETGEIVETLDMTEWGVTDETDAAAVWRARQDIWVLHTKTQGITGLYNSQPALLFGDRFELGKVNLSDVLLEFAQRAGLSSSDLDLTAVTRQIYGAPQKASSVTARGAWEDLLFQTRHDAMMIDGKITVRPRSTAPTGTIGDDDLGADGGPPLKRTTDSASPARRVELSYQSVPANLEPAIQADEFPVEVLKEGNTLRFQTSLRMDDDEAWDAVQGHLSNASAERIKFEAAVPYTRGDVEPGQIWTLTGAGANHDVRITEIDDGLVRALRGYAAFPFLTAAGTPIDSSRPIPALDDISVTDFELVDAHMWRDEDDDTGFTMTAWRRRAGSQWPGGILFRGTDPMTISAQFATLLSETISGRAQNVLGDVVSPNFWDRANTLTVTMVSGEPTSATEADVLNGANPLWVACGSTSEWEMIQFADAVENADGSWTLSNLLRGRMGTEHLTGLHDRGDRVLWADPATAVRGGGSAIGIQYWYQSATVGSSPDTTTRRAFTNRARGKRPYSVVQISGSRDGSSNLTVTWVRRSRIQGDPSQTAIPLGEVTEEYEVEILNAGTVVRTFTGLSSPTVTYTAADQTTDFGSPQASIDVKIYQISDVFGRGVPAEATV